MNIEDLLEYWESKLKSILDDEGFISEDSFATECVYFMNLAKIIDTDEFVDSYFESNEVTDGKINGYIFNDSGERLQIFIVHLESSQLQEDIIITRKDFYEDIFKKSQKIIDSVLKRKISIRDSESIMPLFLKLSSDEGLGQIDTIEFFLLSNTISADGRGGVVQPKSIVFPEEEMQIGFNASNIKKTISVRRRVIDLNFLYNVESSKEPREPVEVVFDNKFGEPISCLKAADEDNYSSYLAVLPGSVLCEIYDEYSNRILEKNVRAFLQFRGKPRLVDTELKGGNANSRMRYTIEKNPERFLAYNNGLTITASSAKFEGTKDSLKIVSLYDFQIVNGGQTTASLYFTHKEGVAIDKVKVSVKINILKSDSAEELEDLIKSISVSSNTQTKVSTVDLSSRNPLLQRIKELSDSCIAPNGNKWFFERARGEFFTFSRKSAKGGGSKSKVLDKARLLTKEQIAKYYMAWGERPFLVKKGGEKVFKDFVEVLENEFSSAKDINDLFFERLVAKAILFNSMHKLYGERNGAIGQIRSATVPYSIACIYRNTKASESLPSLFDLDKIWKDQSLSPKLEEFVKELMRIVNSEILNLQITNDVNEDTKKDSMWAKIANSDLIADFFKSPLADKSIKDYKRSIDDVEGEFNEVKKHQESEVLSVEAAVWFTLSKWAKDNNQFNPTERKFIYNVGKMIGQGRTLSSKQVLWAKRILADAKTNGFETV